MESKFEIEVKIHGKWITLKELPFNSCMGDVVDFHELPNGHLRVIDSDRGGLDFRPVEWRTVEIDETAS